ncbi:phosphoserine phosphatase SerB [Subtercola boreus]|uniref:phosphoserine phosphatase n=2 Tax=Subtercola boreus TaxID=120213 RepID=A0A3E0WDI4_9MICO|nr:phosphoserine phosphatase SerB [Subtercola boreus]RFA21753.1 phosphoserine phosphatase SerB [Subtercola boreus]RFA27724.1 phosphoserine phosphatase SerB [Subtercola boreus]
MNQLLTPDARTHDQQLNGSGSVASPGAPTVSALSEVAAPGVAAPEFAPPAFLVVLDVDSTLIENEVIEMLAECAGSLDEVAHITERAMSGELDFQQSLRSRVSTLAGLPVACFGEVAASIRVTDGADELVAGLHAAGGYVGVVSGGFHELVDDVALSLGLDFWSANRLEVADGVLTGTLVGPVIDAEAKASALVAWAAAAGIPLVRTVAVGDGANDLRMMHTAGLSVAFNAREVVRSAAHLSIDTRDLSQLLPLLGLRG